MDLQACSGSLSIVSACQDNTNPTNWRVTSSATFSATPPCPGGFSFATPRNSVENNALVGVLNGQQGWLPIQVQASQRCATTPPPVSNPPTILPGARPLPTFVLPPSEKGGKVFNVVMLLVVFSAVVCF